MHAPSQLFNQIANKRVNFALDRETEEEENVFTKRKPSYQFTLPSTRIHLESQISKDWLRIIYLVEETEYSDYNVAEENSMRESVEQAINEINSLNDDMKTKPQLKHPQVLFYFDLRLSKDV